MLQDQNLNLSSAQAVTTSAASTSTFDTLTGAALATVGGVYAVPPNYIIGNAAVFGQDWGIGRGKGEPVFVVTTGGGTPAGGTSLQISVQGAVDNGGGTIAGLTFVPYVQTRAIPAASILASNRVATLRWPKREIGQPLPRFVNLYYTVGGSFTGLTLTADLTLGPDDAEGTLGQYPSNY